MSLAAKKKLKAKLLGRNSLKTNVLEISDAKNILSVSEIIYRSLIASGIVSILLISLFEFFYLGIDLQVIYSDKILS